MIGHLKMKVGSDEKVLLMEQLPYYTLVPGEVALRNKIVTCIYGTPFEHIFNIIFGQNNKNDIYQWL